MEPRGGEKTPSLSLDVSRSSDSTYFAAGGHYYLPLYMHEQIRTLVR
jgi:hypothetical protein